jgi:hypothetical protein
MRKPALRKTGILPKGGILRLYGRPKIHKSAAIYEEVWNRLIEAGAKRERLFVTRTLRRMKGHFL